jgi:hypothetical protein
MCKPCILWCNFRHIFAFVLLAFCVNFLTFAILFLLALFSMIYLVLLTILSHVSYKHSVLHLTPSLLFSCIFLLCEIKFSQG